MLTGNCHISHIIKQYVYFLYLFGVVCESSFTSSGRNNFQTNGMHAIRILQKEQIKLENFIYNDRK